MWSLDLGSTNSLLAKWDAETGQPAIVELPAICRSPAGANELEAPRTVPSAVHLLEKPGALARWGAVSNRFLWGKLALIGKPALDANQMRQRPAFARGFKRELMLHPLRTLARAGERNVPAREVAQVFLRELFAEVKRVRGERIRELVMTVPTDAFETYRAELSAMTKRLGVRRLRFLDEPVAAAIGYGLAAAQERRALVVDFGGGTLHIALVQLGSGETREGRARVLAKASRDLGGNLVDRWILEELCRRLDFPLNEDNEHERFWRGLMLAEACRMKEALHLHERASFTLSPPEGSKRFDARMEGKPVPSLDLERGELVRLLEERGLYQGLRECLAEALAAAQAGGVREDAIDDVLMVGGSTLLPGVYSLFEQRFGRSRVRAWQPFEAVAFGAALYAADRVEPSDFIVHDYALLTHDADSQAARPVVVVPAGTRIPTSEAFWKQQLIPTCARGEPEEVFKLVICEIAQSRHGRAFAWDSEGALHKLKAEGSAGANGAEAGARLLVKLNESNPALGHLDPPHSPRDKRPRLELSLGVNAERWLCATVLDLKTRKTLMRGEPVVRLA